jgi:hypothetical protein
LQILKWLAALIGLVLLLVGVAAFAARFGDGPSAVFPGGPLIAGELVTGEPDWSFAREIRELELQLLDPPESRTIWLQVHDQKLYVISNFMNSAVGKIWKKWPLEALADGRAVIRIDGKRYERQLVRILDDAPLLGAIAAEVERKYDLPLSPEMVEAGDVWFFAVEPRPGAASTTD